MEKWQIIDEKGEGDDTTEDTSGLTRGCGGTEEVPCKRLVVVDPEMAISQEEVMNSCFHSEEGLYRNMR
jgi:hypothetical protein